MEGFEQIKQNILLNISSGIDNSPKGNIDIPILDLVNFINYLPEYVTTSSCSGRISCYYSSQTKGIEWVFVKHRTITYQEMKALFQSLDRETDRLLMLKCEPAILHVLCKDLKSAYDLYQIAYACGYRESGIGPGRKIMVAIRTTAFSLEVPIFQGGNFLLTDDGFNVLIHECNMRLIRNFTRIQKLLENMKIAHQWPVLSPTRMSTKLEIFEIVTESNQTDIIPHTSSSLDDFISALNVQHYALLNWTTKVNTSMIDFFIFSGGRKSLERDLPCIWCLTIRHSDIQCPLEFRQTGNIPSNRWGHSLCQFDSRRMLLVGGRNHHSVFDDAYFLEISDNFSENSIIFHWTQIISYPRPIFYHAASFLGQTRGVLVSGGLSDLHLKYSEFELIGSPCYYLISDNNLANGIETKKFLLEEVDGETEVILSSLSWIPADLPQSVKFRFGHTITHVGAQTFLVLGGNSFDPLAVISPESVEIWDVCFGSTLDISPRTLSLSSSCNALELGFGQRSHHQTISLNNRIYVFGGALRSDTLLGPVSTSVVEIHYLPHTHTLPTVDSTSNRDYSNPAMLMPIHLTKRLKNYLESLHWYDKTRRIASPSPDDLSYVLEITSNNDNVKGVSVSAISSRLINWKAIPVTKGFLDLLMKDSSVFFNLVNVLHEEIPLYIIDIQKIALSKVTSSSNHSKVISYLRQLIPEIMMHTSLNRNILNEELQTQLLQDIPPKFEFVGDIIMIPENSLLMVEWGIHFSFSDILQTILDIFNESQKSRYTRIARKAQIDPGPMRESRVKILHPNQPNISGWVEVIENKIRYGFDITKVMFCSGNVTERIRMSKFVNPLVKDETIVDLYAGIGYYTLPFLLGSAAAKHVYACEWNPHSVAALAYNLEKVSISTSIIDVNHDSIVDDEILNRRCVIFKGDNQVSASLGLLSHIADRVCLGLLPSSVNGWPLAVNVLKLKGGILHVHENVRDKEITEWVENCCATFVDLFAVSDRRRGYSLNPMKVTCTHVEHVKSFAPHIIHIVVDLVCTRS